MRSIYREIICTYVQVNNINSMLLFLIETNFVMTVPTPISRSRCMCKMAKLGRRSLVIEFRRYVSILTGPDPGRIQADAIDANALVRKNADAFIGQISPANNKKQHFKRKYKLIMHKFQQNYFFLEMSTKHILKFTSERFVSQKHALKLLRWHSRLLYIPRCFKIYFPKLSKMRFCLRFRKRIH